MHKILYIAYLYIICIVHPSDGEQLYFILSKVCRAFGFQLEQGKEGTPHYQGQVQFLKETRNPSALMLDPDNELVFQSIHWERTSEYSFMDHTCHNSLVCHSLWYKYVAESNRAWRSRMLFVYTFCSDANAAPDLYISNVVKNAYLSDDEMALYCNENPYLFGPK